MSIDLHTWCCICIILHTKDSFVGRIDEDLQLKTVADTSGLTKLTMWPFQISNLLHMFKHDIFID